MLARGERFYKEFLKTHGGNLFDALFILLLWILPFNVFVTVFMEHKVGVANFALYKEGILFLMGIILGWNIFKRRIKLTIGWIDYLIFGYIFWLVLVTLFYPSPIHHIVYGGRYDFEFLIAFLLLRHGISFLKQRPMKYISYFVYSGWIALIAGIVIRWILGEEILIYFGFSGNLSNWNFWGSIPIYHGIDGASVRRFQWIFDGPNPAGFFILLYFGVLATYFRAAKKYYYLLSLAVIVLTVALFYTYSRSALLGLLGWLGSLLLINLWYIWKKHRRFVLWLIPGLLLITWLFYLKFEGTIQQIVLREGSTKGHFDRAVIGLNRFVDKPLGSGLASSGPAYRFVKQPEEGEWLYEWENKIREDYYIPESWYIQQLVEWGIIGFILFVSIFIWILKQLARKNIFLFASFVAMAIMNLFLHTYESVYVSLLLFLIISLVIHYDIPRNAK